MNDVFDGEFQLIKETNLKENHLERKLNYSQIISLIKTLLIKLKVLKVKQGIIIYDTWHLHRAKPIKNKNFARKSIFMQIDKSMRNAEKIILTPDFLSKDQLQDKDLTTYLGFGEKSDFSSAPTTSYKNLPSKSLISIILKSVIAGIKSIIKSVISKILTQEQILKITLKKKNK